ncbi:MAG TPA: hypothetical protein VEC36_07140 [Patescibacteria group bacterium]|nr:hypothetical protein [Patescibacteria group bacterium]
MNSEPLTAHGEIQSFCYQLDFYWQAIAVYAVALLGYILLKGTISEYTLSVVLYDPIVVLLLLFISGSALGMLINWWARREIIVGPDFISFKNRIRERKFTARDILKIHVGNEHDMPVRGRFKTIKIRTTHRRRPLRIRPGSYSDERGLTQAILRLKRNLPARHR